jgi:tRNA(adenine34) deaminase
MCAGAMVNARLGQLVFGAHAPRTGAAGSVYDILSDVRLNHQPDVLAGVLAERSAGMLEDFFARRRAQRARARCCVLPAGRAVG